MKTPERKRGRLASMLRLKCPACGMGNLFTQPNPFHLRRMLEMPDSCPRCGQDFLIEPGFYSGAPYVSYPIVLLLAVPSFLALAFCANFSFPTAFGITLLGLVVVQPVIMRFSRSAWIHIFVRPNRLRH